MILLFFAGSFGGWETAWENPSSCGWVCADADPSDPCRSDMMQPEHWGDSRATA